MAKKKKESDVCPECDIELSDDGTCPGCGWSKDSASSEGEEETLDEEGETDEEEEEEEEF